MKQFIRIGNLVLRESDIIAIDLDHVDYEWAMEEEKGHRQVPFIRLVTREMTYTDVGADGYIPLSQTHDFKHGTPEADAILAWLDPQTEVLTQPGLPTTDEIYQALFQTHQDIQEDPDCTHLVIELAAFARAVGTVPFALRQALIQLDHEKRVRVRSLDYPEASTWEIVFL